MNGERTNISSLPGIQENGIQISILDGRRVETMRKKFSRHHITNESENGQRTTFV